MFHNGDMVKEMDGLRKFAWKLTGNDSDADDLLQNTVLRAMEKKHLFRTDSDLFKWSSKIMYNQFVNQYRRRTKFESQYDPEPHIDRQTTKNDQEKTAEFQEVGEAMDELTDDHREILMMVCVQGMKYKAVADKLDIPVGTVRSRLSRAREQLEEEMDDKESNMARAA